VRPGDTEFRLYRQLAVRCRTTNVRKLRFTYPLRLLFLGVSKYYRRYGRNTEKEKWLSRVFVAHWMSRFSRRSFVRPAYDSTELQRESNFIIVPTPVCISLGGRYAAFFSTVTRSLRYRVGIKNGFYSRHRRAY